MLILLGVGAAVGGFLFFTEQGKGILAQLQGATIYDPKTSPFARGKKGGPMGLEDAREFIPDFIEDLTDPEGEHRLLPFSGVQPGKMPPGYKGSYKQ